MRSPMILFTSDWHLDDNPDNEYRWEVFDLLHDFIRDEGVAVVYQLGDLCDRKDRHSGALVNRIVTSLSQLADQVPVYILKGNHDQPLTGPAYFSFLNHLRNVRFIDTPQLTAEGFMMLPHTRQPQTDWRGLSWQGVKAIGMHQTVAGAVDGPLILAGDDLPTLPALPIFSGDIHSPQQIGPVRYVGAPHPVRYGDTYECQMLLVDDHQQVAKALKLQPIRKLIVTAASVDQLHQLQLGKGDQVRVRFQMPAGQIDQWPGVERAIHEWTARQGVELAAIEPHFTLGIRSATLQRWQDPATALEMFAASEGIDGDLLQAGLQLLED